MERTILIILTLFAFLISSCTRESKDPTVKLDTKALGKALSTFATFPAGKKRCYGVSVDADDIFVNNGGTCRPPLGEVRGFLPEGLDISMSVKLGLKRKIVVMAQLVDIGTPCGDIFTLDDYSNVYKVYSTVMDLDAPETILDVIPTFPGTGNDIATQLNLPTTNCSSSTAPPPPSTGEVLTLGALQSVYSANGSTWNSYIDYSAKSLGPTGQAGAMCSLGGSGAHTCLHAGELKKVPLNGVTTCNGITASDFLGAFKWACKIDPVTSAPAVFSLGLQDGKGLRDLVTSAGWLSNKVMVNNANSGQTAETPLSVWWSNPVQVVPDSTAGPVSLNTTNTVYVIDSNVPTYGFNITASRISVVTLGSFKVSFAGPANCDDAVPSFGAGPDKCAFFASTMDNLWIEVAASNAPVTGEFGVLLHNTRFSRVNMNYWSGFQNPLVFNGGSSNTVSHFKSQAGGLLSNDGIHLISSNYNLMHNIRIDHHSNGINLFNSGNNAIVHAHISGSANQGIYVNGATSMNNSIAGVLSHHNSSTGIFIGGPRNTLIHSTVIGNNGHGLSISGTNMIDVHGVNASGNDFTGSGIRLTTTDQIKLSDVVTTHNISYGVDANNGTNTTILGYFLAGNNGTSDCNATTYANINVSDGTCAGYPSFSGGTDMTSTYVGKVTTTDTTNPDNTNGVGSFGAITEWLKFDNENRGWGPVVATELNGAIRCQSGSCQIYDYTVKITDTVLRDKSFSGNNSNPVITAGVACPAPLNGSSSYTDQHSTPNQFLLRGVEIPGDLIGDDDGLCESNEHCVMTPNIGGYQGEGSMVPLDCNFVDGAVSGVIYFKFSQNGI